VIEELGRAEPGEVRPWQGPILIAASILGALIVGVTEVLSLFHALRQIPLAGVWLLLAVLAYVYGRRRNLLKVGWTRALAMTRGLGLVDKVLLGFFAILAILVFAVAFASPPNNVDALQYHMPRVLHWAQNASLSHFATPYDSQNSRPYWAELAILNLRILWGGDRPANLPQAFSLFGIVIAATGITRLLGGNRRTQFLAGVLAFSVPMGVLQASTPKNDVVSSIWVASTAYFVTLEDRRGLNLRERWALFVSVALAVLTKGTGIPFVAGLLAWYGVVAFRRRGLARLVTENAPAILVVLALNGPFWYRNTVTYGGPFGSNLPLVRSEPLKGPQVAFETKGAASGTGRTGDLQPVAARVQPVMQYSTALPLVDGLDGYVVRWVRMLAMHFVTPVHAVNAAIFRGMRHYPALFPDKYVASLEMAAWNHEMTAGNPLHVVLIAIAFGVLVFTRRGGILDPLVLLALAASFGLFLISFGGCSDTVFCMRYQLSFFYLAAPVVAVVLYRVAPRAVTVAAILVLAYAVPYVLFNNMRPVVGIPPWPTRIRSVFTEDADKILFAQSPQIRDEYEYVATRILEADCRRVGLSTSRDDLEYTLWRLLGAPESGVEIEHLNASVDTQKYIDSGFSPCAVICTACGGLPPGFDMPLASDFGHIRLYLRPAN
jgi:hypothetical protein